MKPRLRSLTCVALLAAQFLAGCTSWQVVDVSPRALVDSAHVTKMQVTERGGTKYVIDAPRLVGDSLTGAAFRVDSVDRRTMQTDERVVAARRVPLAAIDRVAIRKTSGGATMAAVLVVAAAVALVGLISTQNTFY